MVRLRSISRRGTRRTGVALYMAVVCMSILVPLAIVLSQMAILDLSKTGSLETTTQARLTAEGGLSYMESVLEGIRIEGSPTGSDLLVDLADALKTQLAGAVGNRKVRVSDEAIDLPAIRLDKTSSFEALLYFSSAAAIG